MKGNNKFKNIARAITIQIKIIKIRNQIYKYNKNNLHIIIIYKYIKISINQTKNIYTIKKNLNKFKHHLSIRNRFNHNQTIIKIIYKFKKLKFSLFINFQKMKIQNKKIYI